MQLELCPVLSLLLLLHTIRGEWNYSVCPANCLSQTYCTYEIFRQCNCVPAAVLDVVNTNEIGADLHEDLCEYVLYVMGIPEIPCCEKRKRVTTNTRSSLIPMKTIPEPKPSWPMTVLGSLMIEKKTNRHHLRRNTFTSPNILRAKALKMIRRLQEQVRDESLSGTKATRNYEVTDDNLYGTLRK